MNFNIKKNKIYDTIVDILRTPLIQHKYGEYPYVYFVTRPKCKVYVGTGSYSNKFYPIKISSEKDQILTIGKYTSIGDSLNLIMSGGHNYELLTTYPFRHIFEKNMKTFTFGNINIGNDVWIGSDVIIVRKRRRHKNRRRRSNRGTIINNFKTETRRLWDLCRYTSKANKIPI